MTLREIMQLTMANLGEDTDDYTLEEYRQDYALVQRINEGYVEACSQAFLPKTIEAVSLSEQSLVDLEDLEYALLSLDGIYADEEGGHVYSFSAQGESAVRVDAPAGSEVWMEYTYLPQMLEKDTDVPAFAVHYHPALADYAAYRILIASAGNAAKRQSALLLYDRFQRSIAALKRERDGLRGGGCLRFFNKYRW